jgi:hypothetical protein
VKKLAVVAVAAALTLAAVAFSGAAASASPATDPTLPTPGPGQHQVSEYYVSTIYPCNSDQGITRVTIDQAITQEFNGTWYTVSHGRFVKDTSTTQTVYPKVYQCGVVYNPPPAEYPLPGDFLPVWTGASATAPAPAAAPSPAPAQAAPAAVVAHGTPAKAAASVIAPVTPGATTGVASNWSWLRLLPNLF